MGLLAKLAKKIQIGDQLECLGARITCLDRQLEALAGRLEEQNAILQEIKQMNHKNQEDWDKLLGSLDTFTTTISAALENGLAEVVKDLAALRAEIQSMGLQAGAETAIFARLDTIKTNLDAKLTPLATALAEAGTDPVTPIPDVP